MEQISLKTLSRLIQCCTAEFLLNPKTARTVADTPEIKITVEDDEKFEIVEQLKVKLKPEGYNSILIDGLRLENKDCWGLVRASNTTPSLILRFEANTEQKLMEIQELFQKTLFEISTNLKFLN